jgi:hypothetical protein
MHQMKAKAFSGSIVVLCLALLAVPSSAQDLKPLQAEVDNLKQQVSNAGPWLSTYKEPEVKPKPPKNPSRLLASCLARQAACSSRPPASGPAPTRLGSPFAARRMRAERRRGSRA